MSFPPVGTFAGPGVGFPAPPPFGFEAPPFGLAPPPIGLAPPVELNPGTQAMFEERAEYLDDFWQYSRFALPWLLLCFIGLWAIFGLTAWQESGNIKNFTDGTPRILQLEDLVDDDESGNPITLRNLRIAAFTLLIFGTIMLFLIFFARPKPKIRNALNFFFVLVLIGGVVCAWVAFGIGIDHIEDSCFWEENFRFTFSHCRTRSPLAIGAIVLDAGMGTFGLFAALLVAFNTVKGHWRLAPRTWEEEQQDLALEKVKERAPGEMIHKNVSFVRKGLIIIFLLATLATAIASFVLVLILHSDRNRDYLRGPRGRAVNQGQVGVYEQQGWPVVNTRIRYIATTIGLITVFLNFLPFRSRTITILFGFLYFCSGVLLLIAFGFDVDRLRWAHDLPCPKTVDGMQLECTQRAFITTAVLEFIVAVLLFIYIIIEMIVFRGRIRKPIDPVERPYGVFAFSKNEVILPPAPVQTEKAVSCDACAQVSTRMQVHQELECPRRMVLCDMCGDTFQHCNLDQHKRFECSCRSE